MKSLMISMRKIGKSMFSVPGNLAQRSLDSSKDYEGKAATGRRRVLREDGDTLVEMAIACGTLLCMFFGIFEFSLALYSMHYVADAARDASRYAMVNGSACTAMPDCGFTDSSTTLQKWVNSNLVYPVIDQTKLTVTSSWFYPSPSGTQNPTWTACTKGNTCNDPGDMVQVTVTYPFLVTVPFWSAATIDITSTSSMVISQ